MLIFWKFPKSIGAARNNFAVHKQPASRVFEAWFILCAKQHDWKRSIAANKAHFLQLILPLTEARNCADHLRSEISSRALAPFQNIEKTRKQEEAIWITVNVYFVRILIRIYMLIQGFLRKMLVPGMDL